MDDHGTIVRRIVSMLNRRSYHTAVLVICVLVIVTSYAVEVDDLGFYVFGFKWPLHCLLKHTFGIRCAPCGMTHSFSSVAKGDLSAAVGFHKLGPVLFAFIIFQVPYRIWAVMINPKRMGVGMRKTQMDMTAVILTAVFVNWLIYLSERLL